MLRIKSSSIADKSHKLVDRSKDNKSTADTQAVIKSDHGKMKASTSTIKSFLFSQACLQKKRVG